MRFIFAFIIASIISVLLFAWMYHLLHQDDVSISTEYIIPVDISRIKTEDVNRHKELKPDVEEPGMEPISIVNPTLTDTVSDIQIDTQINTTDVPLSVDSNNIDFDQKYWAQPHSDGAAGGEGLGNDGFGKGSNGKDDGLDYIGERNEGKREMVPVASRRPNIPLIAYENHIDGWVLLAFTVQNNGEIKNIRVMDAYPRGIFESNAIIAISSWRYDPFKGPEVNLAQRIEFEWSMYSYNMDFPE